MARHEKEARRAKRKAKKVTNAKAHASRQIGARSLVLADVPDSVFLSLVPIAKVDRIVGDGVSWSVVKQKAEMLKWSVSKYNHIVTSDMHVRCKGIPKERHPLHRFFASHSESAKFATRVGYIHNQVLVRGLYRSVECVTLHIGTVGLTDLHIGFISLANPNVVATKPMDPEQKCAGLGHGVLKDIIENLRVFASVSGFNRITGYAVDRLRASIFCRRGFSLDRNGYMFDTAMEHNRQIPIMIEVVSTIEPRTTAGEIHL